MDVNGSKTLVNRYWLIVNRNSKLKLLVNKRHFRFWFFILMIRIEIQKVKTQYYSRVQSNFQQK